MPNSLPLFVMRNTQTGQLRLSTDPYELLTLVPFGSAMVYKPYDGTVQYIGFMGYVLPAQSVTSKTLLYENLLDVVTDRSYLPAGSTNTSLKAVAGKVIITSVNVAGGGADIAPNAWIEIKGTSLAPPGVPAAGIIWQGSDFVNNQMPTKIGGTSVTVNARPAYVYFVSPTQVNVLTPLDDTTGPVQVQLSTGANQTAPFSVNERATAPSFLLLAPSHYIVGQHADGTLLGPASMSVPGYAFSPAQPGETITLYGAGCGTVPGLVAGSAAQSGALPAAPAVQIGGVSAAVTFAGLVSPGLCQYNVVVPDSAADGDNAVLAVIGGSSTPSGDLISVQR